MGLTQVGTAQCNLHFQEYSGPKRNLGPRGADLVKETSPVSGQPEMGPWTLRKHIPHLKWGRKRLTTLEAAQGAPRDPRRNSKGEPGS